MLHPLSGAATAPDGQACAGAMPKAVRLGRLAARRVPRHARCANRDRCARSAVEIATCATVAGGVVDAFGGNGDAAAGNADALAVLFDFDLGQSGLVEELGKLLNEFAVDQCSFRRFCHSNGSDVVCDAGAAPGRRIAWDILLFFCADDAGEALDRQRVALNTEARHDGLRSLRHVRVVTEGFALVDVGDVISMTGSSVSVNASRMATEV